MNLVHIRLALQQWSLERSHAGGGRSVSEVVSLYVVGIRWPPITPTTQSVHTAPTQYAHGTPVAQMADIGFKVVLLEQLNQKWTQKHF